MKLFKLVAVSLCLLSASAFAQSGKFINNLPVEPNVSIENATGYNLQNVLRIDLNPAAKTIVINHINGVDVENLTYATAADYNAVADKFLTVSGMRTHGALLFYTSQYGSNAHSLVPYTAVYKVLCQKTQPGGGDFYTATITLKTGGAPIVSNGYSIYQCANFLY